MALNSISWLSLLCLILFSTGSSGFENIELINNGDFESSPEQQKKQANAWMMSSSSPASISELFAHSGRYSLRTNNGSAYQLIKTDRPSNLTLSFWVYLHSVPGCPVGRTISAIDILVTTNSSVNGLSYYVSGDHRYPRENIKDIRISNLECDRWNYVVRNLEEDFIKEYPNITFDTVQQINVTVWAFMSPEPIPYWDDISLTGVSKTLKQKLWETTPTETAPAETIPTETTPSSDQPISTETIRRAAALPEDTNSIYQNIIQQRRLIILGLSSIVIFIAMVLVRKRHNIRRINEGDQES